MIASDALLEYPGKITTPFKKLYVPDFLSRASFPHRNPGASTYLAEDKAYIFYIESGHKYLPKEKKLAEIGIPFGIYPRLLMTVIASYAVHYKQREIELSESFTKFIKSLGYTVSGGKRGTISQFSSQLQKLLRCRLCILNIDPDRREILSTTDYLNHINRIEIWENLDSKEKSLNPVKAVLSESFYNRILEKAFPVDNETVEALRSSLLALDLYFFLTSRANRLKGKDAPINWADLEKQLGSNYKTTKEFARNAKMSIEKIKRWYPQLRVKYLPGRLILKKASKPHVKPI